MERKSLPARPSLAHLRKQAKELVRNHRAGTTATFALIRECLPTLAHKSDEEIALYPFALHDAQSVIARQYGFTGWNHLRDEVEKLSASHLNSRAPEESIEAKFRAICASYQQGDYNLFCSVMSAQMREAISAAHFKRVCDSLAVYFRTAYTAVYFGEMLQGEHAVHFWRISAPSASHTDLMARMGVKDDLVSGLLLSAPFSTGKPRGEK